MNRKKLVVIDGNSVFYRGYYAMRNLTLEDGTPTGGIYGFAVMALEVLRKMHPDYVVVAWDKSKTSTKVRKKLYEPYKANRKPMPDDMREQIPYLHKLLDAFGWPLYELDGYEADDIMATLSEQVKDELDTILITSDLDMLQAVRDYTTVAALKKGLTNIEYFDPKSFQEKYGITVEQFIDLKALKGDASDNIPGVKGVGEKTAINLIKKYRDLDGVYEHLDEITGSLHDKLANGKKMAYLSRKLVTIFTDAPIELDKKQADVHNVDPQKVHDKLVEYRFKSLLAKIPESWRLDNHKDQKQLIDMDASIEKSTSLADDFSAKELVLYVFNDELWLSDSINNVYTLKLNQLGKAKEVLADEKVAKIGYDIKESIKKLYKQDIDINSVEHDVKVAAFLINSLIREQSLSSLVGGEIDESNPKQVISAIWQLYEDQKKALKDVPKLTKLAKDIEWPIIPILAMMEYSGIGLDTKYLAKMSQKLEGQISDIEQEIYGYADREFNINSPGQLAEVLFGKLKLPTKNIKTGKTGYSTAASELAKLQDKHPIVDLIYKYREWSKLKNTYVDALPGQVDENSKLHTVFALDVAPTGRLSSRDPNLQNIPVRSELGKTIRTAFVPDKGNVFVAADYSQFELRLAAVLSGEKDMIKAFNEGADVHLLTAAQIANKSLKEVTAEERYNAKAINFGVMYGQGPHALSQQQGISMKEAKAFIERYFEIRPNLRKFIDRIREQAKEQGYVETIFGRRRPTPDVKSSNYMAREAAYRVAVNMPLQGSAADIMKLAMIKIQENFDQQYAKGNMQNAPKMLLQIHDSVLAECAEKDAKKVAKILKDTMENVYDLPVKLAVDTAIGENWGEL